MAINPVWPFTPQPNKWGYPNNPRWTNTPLAPINYDGRESEEPQVWTLNVQSPRSANGSKQHIPCGHWHRVPIAAEVVPEVTDVFAFIGMNMESGRLVKLGFNPFIRDATFDNNPTFDPDVLARCYGITYDSENNIVYMGINYDDISGHIARVVKVNADTMIEIDHLDLATDAGYDYLQAMSDYPENGFIYVQLKHSVTLIGTLYEIRLSDFTVTRSTTIRTSSDQSNCLFPDSARGYIYYTGTNVNSVKTLESHTIPAGAPYTVTVTQSATFRYSGGLESVTYNISGLPLTEVGSSPGQGEYTAASGVYTFNSLDAGLGVKITYIYGSTDEECTGYSLYKFNLTTFTDAVSGTEFADPSLHWAIESAQSYNKTTGKLYCCYAAVSPLYYPDQYTLNEIDVDTFTSLRTLALPVGVTPTPMKMIISDNYLFILVAGNTVEGNIPYLIMVDISSPAMSVLYNALVENSTNITLNGNGGDLAVENSSDKLAIYLHGTYTGGDDAALYRLYDYSSGLPVEDTIVEFDDPDYIESGDWGSNMVVGL